MNQQYIKNVASLEYDLNKCTGCTLCTIVCPHAVFEMHNKKARITDIDRCMECSACMVNCPADAILVNTGVGCAAAVINSMIGKNKGEIACGCDSGCC